MYDGPGFWPQAGALLLVWLAFYLLAIRPSRVAEGRRIDAVDALRGGEEVVLRDGFIGTVEAVDAEARQAGVRIAEGVVANVRFRDIVAVRP